MMLPSVWYWSSPALLVRSFCCFSVWVRLTSLSESSLLDRTETVSLLSSVEADFSVAVDGSGSESTSVGSGTVLSKAARCSGVRIALISLFILEVMPRIEADAADRRAASISGGALMSAGETLADGAGPGGFGRLSAADLS